MNTYYRNDVITNLSRLSIYEIIDSSAVRIIARILWQFCLSFRKSAN